jgi:hypothetical protein
MAKRHLPDAETLRKLLRYEPETGRLYWLPRTPEMFGGQSRVSPEQRCKSWNSKNAGKLALGAKKQNGYLTGCLFGLRVLTHHVAWAIHHGSIPQDQVDHINGDKSDNRACNLRAASAGQNAMNKRRYANNTSGYKGVSFHAGTQKWTGKIMLGKRRIYLGLFDTPAKAHEAYCEASKRYHGEFGRVA